MNCNHSTCQQRSENRIQIFKMWMIATASPQVLLRWFIKAVMWLHEKIPPQLFSLPGARKNPPLLRPPLYFFLFLSAGFAASKSKVWRSRVTVDLSGRAHASSRAVWQPEVGRWHSPPCPPRPAPRRLIVSWSLAVRLSQLMLVSAPVVVPLFIHRRSQLLHIRVFFVVVVKLVPWGGCIWVYN